MQNTTIVYEKRFVAFLDVLGFKEIVNRQDGLEKIQDYFAALNHTISTKLTGLDIDVITISDSVILSVPISSEIEANKIALFAQLCDAVSDFQCAMALNNIWMRGAITFGDCYFSKDPLQIVGPAYIKAYELEQSTAIYPRVIIDPLIIKELGFSTDIKLINRINNYKVTKGFEFSGKLFDWYTRSECIKIDKDIPLFIDYLTQLFYEHLHPDIYLNLNLIVNNLTENLFGSSWSMGVYNKHQWTKKYLYSLCLNELVIAYNDSSSESAQIIKKIQSL